jgi:hypothetical protein
LDASLHTNNCVLVSSRTPHPTSASASPPDSTAARPISDASHSSLLSLSSDTIQALLQKSLRVSFPESRVEHLLRKFTLSLLQSLVSTRVGLADTSANTTTSWPKIPPTGRRYFLRRILRHLASPHHFTLFLLSPAQRTPHPRLTRVDTPELRSQVPSNLFRSGLKRKSP